MRVRVREFELRKIPEKLPAPPTVREKLPRLISSVPVPSEPFKLEKMALCWAVYVPSSLIVTAPRVVVPPMVESVKDDPVSVIVRAVPVGTPPVKLPPPWTFVPPWYVLLACISERLPGPFSRRAQLLSESPPLPASSAISS